MVTKKQALLMGALVVATVYAAVWAYYESHRRQAIPESSQNLELTDSGPAPAVGISTAHGPLQLASLKGKVVLLDFWATWCGPCRMSIPGVETLYREKHRDGLEVLGVSIDQPGADVAGSIKELGMTYPAGRFEDVSSVYAYNASSIPLTVLVDRAGHVRLRKSGYWPGMDRDLGRVIDVLLRE